MDPLQVSAPADAPENTPCKENLVNSADSPAQMTIGLLPDHSINKVASDNENPFDFLAKNHHVTPIPELGNIEDKNPFQQVNDARPLTPISDLHL